MIILITGKPRSGKTTLVKNIIRQLPHQSYGGFYTEEVRNSDNNRTGFKLKTTDGKETVLADINLKSQYQIGKYKVNITGIETIGIETINQALNEKAIIIIDEIGKMELCSEKFQNAIQLLLANLGQKILIATVPISNLPIVAQLKQRTDAIIFDTSKNKNAVILNEILSLVKNEKIS
ncbi:MAG: nucleoside-triphosphatase [candidate division WOR-3 bacterium]